jgi:hypothetical protein
VSIAAATFIRIGVSPAKAAINSDRATAEKLTGAWLPCQQSNALQWPAPSNYRLKAEDKLQIQSDARDERPLNDRSGIASARRGTGAGHTIQHSITCSRVAGLNKRLARSSKS